MTDPTQPAPCSHDTYEDEELEKGTIYSEDSVSLLHQETHLVEKKPPKICITPIFLSILCHSTAIILLGITWAALQKYYGYEYPYGVNLILCK